MSATGLDRMLATARRDLLIERTYHFQFLFRFVGIVVTAATFFYISKLVGTADALQGVAGGYFAFALIGSLLISATFLGLNNFSETISEEQSNGTLETLLVTGTGLGTFLAGAFIVPLILTGIEALLYLVVGVGVFGLRVSLADLAVAVPLALLTIVPFAGFGILSAAFIVLTKRGDPFSGLISQATNFIAGAVFPVALLPGPLQVVARLIPAFHGLNAIRGVLLEGASLADVADEALILVGFSLVFLPLAMWAFRRTLAAARVTGTLGGY